MGIKIQMHVRFARLQLKHYEQFQYSNETQMIGQILFLARKINISLGLYLVVLVVIQITLLDEPGGSHPSHLPGAKIACQTS